MIYMRLQVLPLDICDGPSVVLLSPNVIVCDSPNHSHNKDERGPVEVGCIGLGCNREEHEDEEYGFEAKGAGERSESQYLRCDNEREGSGNLRQVAEQAEALAQIEARRWQWLAGETAVCHAANTDHVASEQCGVAERAECEEGHRRSEDDHAEYDCMYKSVSWFFRQHNVAPGRLRLQTHSRKSALPSLH